jgi:signal transduction histidine kinase
MSRTDSTSRSVPARAMRVRDLSISARSAMVSAIVVLVGLALSGAVLTLLLYRYLLTGVDDATAGRVRNVVGALQATSPDRLEPALFSTNQRVVAVQVIGPNGDVVKRAGDAPAAPLVPVSRFENNLLRGLPDDAVTGDDMRVSGQQVDTPRGRYTVIVGGGSEAVESTVTTVALLLACGAPIVVGLAATATYRLVRRSLQSVDAIRSRVAEISTSDLGERVPVPGARDEISALATTMNEMLSRLEAGHRAQQRFVSDASHELRSPLTTIISGLEAARDHPALLNPELASQTLLPEAHRMRVLIDDLFLLARADEHNLVVRKDVVPIGELADLEVARVRREASCEVNSNVASALVIGDPIAITRVLRNLLDNAVRHARSRVCIDVRPNGDHVDIAISDDGPGIALPDRERVFERFVRLDFDRSRNSGGAGLGLAIVAELVAAHRGSIAVEGRPGAGTTMRVRLPQPSNR